MMIINNQPSRYRDIFCGGSSEPTAIIITRYGEGENETSRQVLERLLVIPIEYGR